MNEFFIENCTILQIITLSFSKKTIIYGKLTTNSQNYKIFAKSYKTISKTEKMQTSFKKKKEKFWSLIPWTGVFFFEEVQWNQPQFFQVESFELKFSPGFTAYI